MDVVTHPTDATGVERAPVAPPVAQPSSPARRGAGEDGPTVTSGSVQGWAGPLVTAPRKRRPKDIGTDAERAVVRYLQANGFPHAERRALRGQNDAGDITGTPGICWEVKARNRPVSDAQIDTWLSELATERANARADVGILVIRRPGFGPANAGSWWAITSAPDLFHIHGGITEGLTWGLLGCFWTSDIPVRLTLAHAVRLLRLGGWGEPFDPLTEETP